MSLELNIEQRSIQIQSTPVLQDWGFNPDPVNITYTQGDDMPAPVVVATTLKDIIGTAEMINYQGAERNVYLLPNAQPNCVLMQGDLVTGQNTYGPYENGMQGDVTYTFQNLNLLSPGRYTWRARHQIWKRTIVNNYISAGYRNLAINVTVRSNIATTFSDDVIHIDLRMGQEPAASIAGPFTVNGGAWTMFLPNGLYFSELQDVEFVTLPTGIRVSGSEEATFYILMFWAAVPDPLVQNPYTLYLEIDGGELRIPIIVTILQPSGFFVEFPTMFFEAYKGIQDAAPQTNHMSFPGEYYFVVPPWLTISPDECQDTVTTTFSVMTADNMEPGTYVFKVEVWSSVSGGIVAYINVTYVVHGNIISPYRADTYNFTLDKKFIELMSQQDDMFYEMAMTVTISEMYTLNQQDLSVYNFRYPLFQRKQQFNIGLTIDRLMSRFKDFIQNSRTPYFPAKVSLSFVEKSTVDAAYRNAFSIPDIYFIAGLDPGLFEGCGILDINQAPSRITPRTEVVIVNYVLKDSQQIAWYKNGEQVRSYLRTEGLYADRIEPEEPAPGDVFEFRIITMNGTLSKYFRTFPEGKNSTIITWENEYKLKSEMEFTGDFNIKSELENRTQQLFNQLVDVLRKLESTKISKFTINTGWILKTDLPSIESLLRSKRAAIRLPEDKYINLVPLSKTITNVDNKRALVDYEVEFQINRNYNEEIYSF